MRREGKVYVSCNLKAIDGYKDYLAPKYNKQIATNRSFRFPHYCPQNKKTCIGCSHPEKDPKLKRIDIKKQCKEALSLKY